MIMSKTLTIVVTCRNEEGNIDATINTIFNANKNFGYGLDIIIVNDGSVDKTLEKALSLQSGHENIRVINHKNDPKGLGTSFLKGLILAKGEYFTLFPGDNQITEDYMVSLFSKAGVADLVLSYPKNSEIRPLKRRIFSNLFVKINNLLFGLNLKYYNGPAIFKTELLQDIDAVSRFFSYHAEAVTKFIKKGHSYVEVGGLLKERDYGVSTALKFYNFVGVILGTIILLLDVYYMKRNIYNKKPNCLGEI